MHGNQNRRTAQTMARPRHGSTLLARIALPAILLTIAIAALCPVTLADGGELRLLGQYVHKDSVMGATVVDNLAYVTTSPPGSHGSMCIVDMADPSEPNELASSAIGEDTDAIAISDTMAYVGTPYKLLLLDIADSSNIVARGVYTNTEQHTYGVAVSGTVACLSAGWKNKGKLCIVDVSDPEDPHQIGMLNLLQQARGVVLNGSRAFVAASSGGLQIVDISDPSRPSSAVSIKTPGSAYGIAVDGNYAYIAGWDAGLRIVDVSNLAALREVGSCDTPGFARDVAIEGSLAYVADHSGGLRVIDVSDPTAPHELASYETADNARHVAIWGSRAYVSAGDAGLLVLQWQSTPICIPLILRT